MYQLLTDSCCDLPYQTLHDHQVEFVSMHFTVNGTDYEDDLGEDHYDINAFYEQLKQNVMPTTTQVNVGQFVDFFTVCQSKHAHLICRLLQRFKRHFQFGDSSACHVTGKVSGCADLLG